MWWRWRWRISGTFSCSPIDHSPLQKIPALETKCIAIELNALANRYESFGSQPIIFNRSHKSYTVCVCVCVRHLMMGSCIFHRTHSLSRTHRLRQTTHHNHRLFSQRTNAWSDDDVLETLTRESCTYTMRLCNKRVIEMKTSEKKLKWKTTTAKSELTHLHAKPTPTHMQMWWNGYVLLCIFYFCCLNKMESERERSKPA